jgi:GNAT superfamily N-acetyltransferase
MTRTLSLRTAQPDDLPGVDLLLSRSYPRLLARDYPPSVLVTAVPLIARAKPDLLASGRYYVVEDAGGRILGAGGYSLALPARRTGPDDPRRVAHIRHVATDPDATRRGIASAIVRWTIGAAVGEGVLGFECLSTRTAVPFYAAMGFVTLRKADVTLAPGISFPAVLMQRPPVAP